MEPQSQVIVCLLSEAFYTFTVAGPRIALMFWPPEYFPWTYRCSDWELWTNTRTELCLHQIQSDNYCRVRKKQHCPCRFVLESQVPLCCKRLSHLLDCIWLHTERLFQKSVRKTSFSGCFTEVRIVRNHGSS